MIRIGIVCEGVTDIPIFEAILQTFSDRIIVQGLHPETDALMGKSRRSNGWTNVKKWCVERGSWIEQFMSSGIGTKLDILIIHLDADMAGEVGIKKDCPPPNATTDALRQEIRRWFGRTSRIPQSVVFATPSKSTETWIAAAIEEQSNINLECSTEPWRSLIDNGPLRADAQGKPVKDPNTYRVLADKVGPLFLEKVCAKCSEANRFRGDVTNALLHCGIED